MSSLPSRDQRASALRRQIRTLDQERASCLNILLELRDLFAASLSVVYRTCGKPNCRCAQGHPHGPYYFLSIQSAGRNDRAHLSPRHAQAVQPALKRYRLFFRTLRRLRALDRRIEGLLRRLQRLCETRSTKSFTTS